MEIILSKPLTIGNRKLSKGKQEVSDSLAHNPLFVSIAAGITISQMEKVGSPYYSFIYCVHTALVYAIKYLFFVSSIFFKFYGDL